MSADWKCSGCDSILATIRRDGLHVTQGKARFMVRGTLVIACRSCDALNVTTYNPPAGAPGETLTPAA